MAFPLKVNASYEELAAVAELDDRNRPIVPPLFAHTEPGDREWLAYHGSLLKVLLQRYKALPVTPCADLTQQYLHHAIHSCGERTFRHLAAARADAKPGERSAVLSAELHRVLDDYTLVRGTSLSVLVDCGGSHGHLVMWSAYDTELWCPALWEKTWQVNSMPAADREEQRARWFEAVEAESQRLKQPEVLAVHECRLEAERAKQAAEFLAAKRNPPAAVKQELDRRRQQQDQETAEFRLSCQQHVASADAELKLLSSAKDESDARVRAETQLGQLLAKRIAELTNKREEIIKDARRELILFTVEEPK